MTMAETDMGRLTEKPNRYTIFKTTILKTELTFVKNHQKTKN